MLASTIDPFANSDKANAIAAATPFQKIRVRKTFLSTRFPRDTAVPDSLFIAYGLLYHFLVKSLTELEESSSSRGRLRLQARVLDLKAFVKHGVKQKQASRIDRRIEMVS